MYNYQPKSYADMLAIAKQISPDAQLRKVEYNDTWEIYIETEFSPTATLPAEYEGTPAWEAAQVPDSHGDLLTRWANKSGRGHMPIECVADYYNFRAEYDKELLRHTSAILDAENADIDDFRNATLEQLDTYRILTKKAKDKTDDAMALRWDELKKKWKSFL